MRVNRKDAIGQTLFRRSLLTAPWFYGRRMTQKIPLDTTLGPWDHVTVEERLSAGGPFDGPGRSPDNRLGHRCGVLHGAPIKSYSHPYGVRTIPRLRIAAYLSLARC